MKARDTSAQLELIFPPPTITPRGDGTYIVSQAKPVTRLTPTQFAKIVGLRPNTIYGHIDYGWIPPEYVERAGPRKLYIHAAAVEIWKARWKKN